jgi:hypothetical protein
VATVARLIICGVIGTGEKDDPIRPQVADEAVEVLSAQYSPDYTTALAAVDDASFLSLAWSETNPDGYDWMEFFDDGTVVVHGA